MADPNTTLAHSLSVRYAQRRSNRLPRSATTTGDSTSAWERAFVDLGGHVAPLVGPEGYRALLGRSLAMASDDFSILRGVRPGVAPPGRLVGLHRHAGAMRVDVESALEATCAALLSLLDRFIGRDLTQAILHETWPAGELGGPAARPIKGEVLHVNWPSKAG